MSMVKRIDSVLDKLDGLLVVQELYEAILNNVPFGMVLVNKDFIIERVNESICQYTGYSRDDLHGQPITILMPKDQRAAHYKFEKAFKKNPTTRHGNKGLKPVVAFKNGERRPVEISLSPFVFKGEGKVLVCIRDIQDIKESLGEL